MKIIVYCQHVLGVGHFFRTLEILKALCGHDVVLVTGGGHIDADLPSHVRQVKLPGLMMDEKFSGLHSVDPSKTVEEIKALRKDRFMQLVKKVDPDLFITELYPFGRRAFRFELVPVLEYLRGKGKKLCKVVCSLRDILVEREDPAKYENRVIKALNAYFDAVLVHSDPNLVSLENTFGRIDRIKVPLVYTGFITPHPELEKVEAIRAETGLGPSGKLVVASAGGGNVGARLLRATLQAARLMIKDQKNADRDLQFQVFTGPYMDDADKNELRSFQGERILVKEFTSDFVSLLGAADLSISMGGYNTSMNIVAAGVKSFVWPFGQNREQRTRAQSLARYARVDILEDSDLHPERLSRLLERALDEPDNTKPGTLNLAGAENTAGWIKNV